MYAQDFFLQALVYLAAAVVSVPIAKRLGLGSVLGYLIAGVVIGPFGLALVGEEGQDVMHFAEFGVVMMLFLIGLELRPRLLWNMRSALLGLGGLQVGATALLLGAAAWVGLAGPGGLAWQESLAVGGILALSSTAMVLQTLQEKNLTRTDAGQNAFSVLLFQDIAVIPMLALLPLLATHAVHHGGGDHGGGGGETWVAGLPGWAQTLVVLGVVAGIVLVGRFLARHAFRFVAAARLREIFTASALVLVVGVALLMSRIGLSPALGTFIAGVVLADSEYRHELEGDIEPFKGLLLGVFFIAVGASMDFALIAAEPARLAVLVAVLVALKFLVLLVLGRGFGMGLDQNLVFAVALAQGGEFAYVLLGFAVQNGVVTAEVSAPLIAVVAVSMAVTPLLLFLLERFVQPRVGTRETEAREADTPEEEAPVIIAGFGRFGSMVGRLLAANGVKATVFDHDSDHVEVLRKLGFRVYYGDASRPDLLKAAGADHARLLVVALDDPDHVLRTVHTAKKHFPDLRILARAQDRPESYALLDAGVDRCYRETLDTSLRMGVDALQMLGRRGYFAQRSAERLRRHDEAAVRELAGMRDDRQAYLNTARQRIRELEEALLADLEGTDLQRDAGWDVESLRADFGRSSGEDGSG